MLEYIHLMRLYVDKFATDFVTSNIGNPFEEILILSELNFVKCNFRQRVFIAFTAILF